jgi:hypothetical protein
LAGVKKAALLRRRSGELARRRASIGPNQLAGDGTFVAFTRLHLLEGMGQCADRTG